MLKAIIIDDEKNGITLLQNLLEKYFKDIITVTATADSAEAGLACIKKQAPDVVFLDVEMPFKSGFDMLETLGVFDFEVIFTTAHNKYALKAIKISALDYLLKPIDLEELKSAIDKLVQKNTHQKTQLADLFQNRGRELQHRKQIGLPTNDGVVFVYLDELVRCESDKNYTNFYFDNKKKLLICRTLKEVDELLSNFHFFRIHKSHLVNMNKIKQYKKAEGGQVIMADDASLPLSKEMRDKFISMLPIL